MGFDFKLLFADIVTNGNVQSLWSVLSQKVGEDPFRLITFFIFMIIIYYLLFCLNSIKF